MTPAPWDPIQRASATAEQVRKYAAANALRPATDETRKPLTQIAASHHAPAQK